MSASTASFQKTVNYQIAPGQPGDRAGHGPECVRAYMATTETVPGTFVINVDTLNATASATSFNTPKKAGYSTGVATGVIAGLVIRSNPGLIGNLMNSYQNNLSVGQNIQVASQGEFKVTLAEISGGTAKIGMQVTVADRTTGVPTLVEDGTAGALNWWFVEVLDAASGLGVISSWRKA